MAAQARPGAAALRPRMRLSFVWSTIYEDSSSEAEEEVKGQKMIEMENEQREDYSYSEISQSFTIRRPSVSEVPSLPVSQPLEEVNEDTDIELDDELKEFSEVRFEDSSKKTKEESETVKIPARITAKPIGKRTRSSLTEVAEAALHNRQRRIGLVSGPVTQELESSHEDKNHQHNGLCNCAPTYRMQREKRTRAMSMIHSGRLQQSEETSGTDENSEESAISSVRMRKRSKTNHINPIEGTFRLVGSKNFEAWLSAIGTGPCSQNMVMRANQFIKISQEPDKQWRISTETVIRAKSVRGYRTNNRKWTENKFKEGDAKPELLDDWDQRLVVTTLNVDPSKTKLTLQQEADKDQWHAVDSTVEFEIPEDDEDTLLVTFSTGEVTAWRKFARQKQQQQSRKFSSPI